MTILNGRLWICLLSGLWASAVVDAAAADGPVGEATASGTAEASSPAGAIDGDRFSTEPESVWTGDAASCSWTITFPEPQAIGSLLQINGDDRMVLRNAPRNYVWQWSNDGESWRPIPETVVTHEKRIFRIHRLREPIETRHLRLLVHLSHGTAPTIREVEFYPGVDAEIPFDDWIIAVSSVEDPGSVEVGMRFVNLARECEGWENVSAQLIWHGDFDEEFVSTEPRPLCAFFSGSYLEWCQRSREPWRGVQAVLKSRNLPMWGACGGAQVFAILEETGVDKPWDCPRCRNADNPLSPIYSHIGHLAEAPCGDYSQNIGERGVFKMQVIADDPAFEGLPDIFEIQESHIGQIDYVPEGWTRVVTKGPGAHTENQVLRVKDCPIYSAQFHMETYANTPENSVQIMSNFLKLAKEWGGYNPDAQRLEMPEPMKSAQDESGE